MIKTIKVTVAGEKVSYYIDPKHRKILLEVLEKLDMISTPASTLLPELPKQPLPEEPVFLTREQGGCSKCGKFRGKRRQQKMLCRKCHKERWDSKIN